MVKKKIIDIWDKIFGDWFKNIMVTFLLIPTIFLIIWGIIEEWIGQSFGIELLFLLLGIFIGKWLENGKK